MGRKDEPATPAPKASRADAVAEIASNDLSPEKKQLGAPMVANPYEAAADAVEVAVQPKPADAGPPAAPRGAELRAAVLAVLRDAAMGPEGLHVDALAEKARGAAAAEVRAIVAELVDDGELYSTITEEHFAAV